MNNIQKDIIRILKAYVNKNYDFNISSSLDEIYELSNKYAITPVIGYTLNKAHKENELFLKNLMMSSSRYESQKFVREKIKEILDKNNIKFVFIKGCTLAKYYDEEYLRFSSDIDVVIEKGKNTEAKEALINSGIFEFVKDIDYELSLKTKNNVSIDLHRIFTKYDDEVEELFNDVEFNSDHELNNDFKLLHLLIHGAKHIRNGFISFQFLIDLDNIRKLDLKKEYVDKLLKKANLLDFYHNSINLVDVLFYDAESDTITNEYLDYLLNENYRKGIKNKIISTRIQNKKGKLSYMLYRFFPDLEYMKQAFPNEEIKDYLLPYYYIKRFILCYKRHGVNDVFNELKNNMNIDNNTVEDKNKLFDKIG